MGEPRKAELALSVASCMLWQTAGSSRKALLDLAPLFLGEPRNKQPFLQYTPAPCLLAGRLQQCGTRGNADGNRDLHTAIKNLYWLLNLFSTSPPTPHTLIPQQPGQLFSKMPQNLTAHHTYWCWTNLGWGSVLWNVPRWADPRP